MAAAAAAVGPKQYTFKEVTQADAPAIKQTLNAWGATIDKMETKEGRNYDLYLAYRLGEYRRVVTSIERRALVGIKKEDVANKADTFEFRLVVAYDTETNICSISDFTVHANSEDRIRDIIKNPAYLRHALDAHPKVRGVATAQMDYIKQVARETHSRLIAEPHLSNVDFYKAKGFQIADVRGYDGVCFIAKWPRDLINKTKK